MSGGLKGSLNRQRLFLSRTIKIASQNKCDEPSHFCPFLTKEKGRWLNTDAMKEVEMSRWIWRCFRETVGTVPSDTRIRRAGGYYELLLFLSVLLCCWSTTTLFDSRFLFLFKCVAPRLIPGAKVGRATTKTNSSYFFYITRVYIPCARLHTI